VHSADQIAPLRLAPAVVVFDYGEVISYSPPESDRLQLTERAGITPAHTPAFWRAYWHHREELDRGTVSIADYWARVGDEIGVSWHPLDIDQMWALDHRSWLSLNPDTLRVLQALKAGGTRLALLSNAGVDFSGWLRHGTFSALFERVFVSGELHLVKPDPAIYEHVIRELGINPAEFLFIDNRADNVDGARAVGGEGHVFTDASRLERWLRELSA